MSRAARFTGSAAVITRLDRTFSEDLTFEDRARLRHIVRRSAPYLFKADDSNRHVDQVIDAIGPKVMRQRLLQAIADGKVA